MFSIWCLDTEEEPYLIFANRYYLRKLNLDGSNYTLIKQVRNSGSQFDTWQHNKVKFFLLAHHTLVNTVPICDLGSE